ncbi:TPA: hypothetical protein QCR38_003863 [Bacillus cereus]|nr:hypothetical protein [Bacillus cereus]
MAKNNKDKVIYLVSNADKKFHVIDLYSLPAKCPVCHPFQEPKPISFHFNKNDDAIVQFNCVNASCKSSFLHFI